MSDPLDRDEYPDRPDSPDFWSLSECVLWMDGRASEGKGFRATLQEFIDTDVAEYFAKSRAGMALLSDPTSLPSHLNEFEKLRITVAAAWIDGFMAGAKFQQDHGK